MKNKLFWFLFFLAVVFIFSGGLLHTFFQQDEWNGFGIVLVLSQQPWWSWFQVLAGQHVVPFTALFWFGLFKIFSYSATDYALCSLLLHSFASFLVFLLARKLTKSFGAALLTGILFAVNHQSNQAYLHLGVFGNTVTAFICFVSFLLYSYDLPKKMQIRNIVILLILFFSAVFFREDGLILIPLLPVFLFLFNKKVLNRTNVKFFILFYSFSLGFLLFRFASQLFNTTAVSISSRVYYSLYIYNAVSLPIKIFVQELIYGNDLFMFLWQYGGGVYHQTFDFSVYTSVFLDLSFLIIALLIFGSFLAIGYLVKDRKHIIIAIFSGIVILLNSLLLAAVGRRLDLVESRYLYLSSFPFFLFLSVLLYGLFQKKFRTAFMNWISKLFVIAVISYLIVNSFLVTRKELTTLSQQSEVRQQLVKDMFALAPVHKKQVVFYVQCKNDCYENGAFGINNKYVLPFSFGPGYILLVNYAKNNPKVYTKFLEKTSSVEFLWDYGSQGYKEIDGYGFGYFYQKKDLLEAMKKDEINSSNVIGFEYDQSHSRIIDISTRLRKEIAR